MKQKKFVNEPKASYQVHDLNQVVWLINKILLFQYSEGIFSAHRRGVAFKVTHNAQLIKLFLTHKSSLLHSFLMRRYPCMNIATKEFR